MRGLKYQMKSVLRDKFCLMTFLLTILVAVALHFMGSIDMSSLGELHFGVLENELSPQTVTWLKRYGPVTAYGTQEELTAAINEPSTNVIGVRADGDSLKTAVSGDELDIFRQAAATLPTLYERREAAGQAEIQTLERPDIMESLQGIFIPAVLIVAMFMGCTFNAMNIISEKEDGVILCGSVDWSVYRKVFRGPDDWSGLYQDCHAAIFGCPSCMRSDRGKRAAGVCLQYRPVPAGL